MSGRARFWWAVAALSTIINLPGTVYAAMLGEALHSAAHAAALVVTALLVRRYATPRRVASYRA